MAKQHPRTPPERLSGPERWDKYDEVLRRLRTVEDEVTEISEHFNLTHGEALALAVVYCSQALHVTDDPDTCVLVVRNAKIYDNAVEAFLATANEGKYRELFDYLQARRSKKTKGDSTGSDSSSAH